VQVLAFFTNDGVPQGGLTPTIRIRDVDDNSLVVTDAAASEVGDGWYKYDFVAYDAAKEYAIRFDGGAALADSDRYTSGTNDSFVDDIVDGVWDEPASNHLISGSMGNASNEMNNDIKRTLGLLHENIYIDQPVYDDNGNMISARVRTYDDKTNVGTSTGVIETYLITADGTECGQFHYWKQVVV